MKNELKLRYEKVYQEIQNQSEKIDAFLVTKIENIRYLSMFTGSTAMLVIDYSNAYLFVDFRYIEQAKKETSNVEVIQSGRKQLDDVCEFLKSKNYKNIAVEGNNLSINNFKEIESKLNKNQKLISTSALIEKIRMIKSKNEISLIKKSVNLTDAVFSELISDKKNINKKSELEIAAYLEFLMKCNGAQNSAFEPIVAFGPNSAFPHYKPSLNQIINITKKKDNGNFLKIDFGAKLNGYCSDMTRTLLLGKISQKHIDIYNIALEAQIEAINKAKPGMLASEIDALARNVIKKYGYDNYFGHGLGHGVGLEIHEMPAISPQTSNIMVMPNMVFTIEPGIYIPGFGGVRIEDIVVMEENGCKILTKTSKKLLIIE